MHGSLTGGATSIFLCRCEIAAGGILLIADVLLHQSALLPIMIIN